MLDFSRISEDIQAVADRWAFERLLRTNRGFRQQRVARMIAARNPLEDNLFSAADREFCAALDRQPENIFA